MRDVNGFGNRLAARGFDSQTSLCYYRARYYDAMTGRFLIEDHLGFDAGNNFYEYAANRPLNYVDPFGTCIIEMWVVHTGENNDGTLYHSFLTFYDNSGQHVAAPTMIFRGAMGEGMDVDPVLSATRFPLNTRSIDQPSDSLYMAPLLSNDCGCAPYIEKMDQLIKEINDKHVPYRPWRTSNSVTYTAIKNLGLTPPKLPVSVLKFLWGWGFSATP